MSFLRKHNSQTSIENGLTDPSFAGVRLESISSIVDFPAPEGPMTDASSEELYGCRNRILLTCEHLSGFYFARYIGQYRLPFNRIAYVTPLEDKMLIRPLGLYNKFR